MTHQARAASPERAGSRSLAMARAKDYPTQAEHRRQMERLAAYALWFAMPLSAAAAIITGIYCQSPVLPITISTAIVGAPVALFRYARMRPPRQSDADAKKIARGKITEAAKSRHPR